jgi:hypothetical protein
MPVEGVEFMEVEVEAIQPMMNLRKAGFPMRYHCHPHSCPNHPFLAPIVTVFLMSMFIVPVPEFGSLQDTPGFKKTPQR